MRVLHVIAGAKAGGAETIALDVMVALAEYGIEQHVICRPHPIMVSRLEDARIPFTVRSFSRLDRLAGLSAAIDREARRFNADVAQAWMSRAASFIPPEMPCPVIGWFGGYYDMKYYRNVDFFAGLTRDLRSYFLQRDVPAERAFVIHTFGTLPPAAPIDRAALSTPVDAPVVLVLSRMHPKKGIDTILQALVEVPGVYLWLAGAGPEFGAYRKLSQALGLADRVRFLGWRTDRRALMEAADIVALPSRYEPFGTVIVEAWAMSRPLIVTRTAGALQYASDNIDSLVCPIDNPRALAEAIERLARDPGLRRTLAQNGYRTYKRLFSKEVVIQDLTAIYAKAVSIGRRSADPALR